MTASKSRRDQSKDNLTVSNTESAFLGELDEVASDATEAIDDVCIAFPIDISDSAGYVLGNCFRCDRVPTLLINLNPSVVLAEKVVPVLEELREFFFSRLLTLLVNEVVSL